MRRLLLLLLLLVLFAPAVRAQESGGSFGGSSWDDEPSGGGGGGSDWGGGGGESWGSSSPSSWEEDRRADDEARRAREEEERRRAEEEARRRAEEERARREAEEARRAAERARLLALPPVERARQISFPETPPEPVLTPPDLRLPDRYVAGAVVGGRVARPPELSRAARFTGGFNPGSLCCGFALFLVFLPVTVLMAWRRSDAWKRVPDGPSASSAAKGPRAIGGQARRITLAFDWTVRAVLQAELKAMSQRLDMKTRPGLHAAAQEVVRLLFKHASAARYATWELSQGDARSWFTTRQNDLRSRFQTDRVRNIGGAQLGAGSGEHVARPEEGEGLVVISVLIAGKSPMPVPRGAASAEDVAKILSALVPQSPSEMLALEVIWSPSEELDRMSSLELERFYPELMRFGSGVGRYACTYCHAPYPRELGRCPACGAPTDPDKAGRT